ncbi:MULTISPECIES: DUF6671 family protein [Trichocoleus]|uniref:DUF6671 domain-containing protein n=1 Tax=Trichocoleus desertorum GB2-A4 TaxID=2933944 RepID=A0ABV0J5G6_9CYAN|nr:DUF6671 family protein [Trichocoleus sp. FACHB-46]MBD1863852.1 hypothetical protein [Trichocoleus sp. FACHB-46]
MSEPSCFTNRVAVLATMHYKEKVIAPILELELGLKIVVPPHLDTDRFGTFTREQPRPGNQLETAQLKAQQALALTGETLAIASEGAFGPHPQILWLSCDREIVLLLDQRQGIEIVGQTLSTETNFASQTIASYAEAQAFAAKAGFPTHGLIIMSDRDTKNSSAIYKGIRTETALYEAVKQALAQSTTGRIHIETDMRAMHNPTRMQAIAAATEDLVRNIRQVCPQCGCPGFAIVEALPGLLCAHCHSPTRLTRSVRYECQKCHSSEEVLFPNGLTTADPAQCLYCNP